MKSLSASAALLAVVLAMPAYAADLVEVPMQAAPVAAPVFSWTGPYGGLRGGMSFTNGDFNVLGTDSSQHYNGGQIGGFLGANYQMDTIVIGIEGDLGYTWDQKESDFLGSGVEAGTDLSGSVRARLGYAFDRALLYTTAGWTGQRAYIETSGDKEDKTFNGWTIGAGVDYAFTDNVFGRAEYRYNDYGSKTIRGTDVDLDQHLVSAGIGLKF
jgi:outer membrane immunogenic protein